jgi:hypothetical protein
MASRIIIALHGIDAAKLEAIKSEMLTLGAPSVRCVEAGGEWYAIEGTHRLAAACELGLVPEIVEVTEESGPQTVDLDGDEDERDYQWIVDYVTDTRGGRHGAVYRISADGMDAL